MKVTISGWTFKCPCEEYGEHGVFTTKEEAIARGKKCCRGFDYFLVGEVPSLTAGEKLRPSNIAGQLFINNIVEEV